MTKYHVRAPNGVSIDMLDTKHSALDLARNEKLEVYELTDSGIATLIYAPPRIVPISERK